MERRFEKKMNILHSAWASQGEINAPTVLQKNTWFASLPSQHQGALIEAAQRMQLSQGQHFASREQLIRRRKDGFAVLVEGLLKICASSSDGREAILSFVHPGQWFGEVSVLDGQARENDYVSIGTCELLVIETEVMHQLLKDADLACHIARLMASRTRLLVALAEGFTLRSSLARTAKRLFMLAYDDEPEQGKHRDTLDVSQDALASMLGMTRQSVASQLRLLSECGAIEQAYGRVKIASIAALKAQAG
jgi:CRP/FNR family transcriptional regulator, cyclic AMP receptor protein